MSQAGDQLGRETGWPVPCRTALTRLLESDKKLALVCQMTPQPAATTWLVQQGMAPLLGWYGLPACEQQKKDCRRALLLSRSMQKPWLTLCRQLAELSCRHQRPGLAFKGQALAYAIYPEPALRVRSDLDWLVPEEHRDWWANRLQEMGFSPISSRQGRWVSFQNTYVKPLPGGRRLLVDLHWQINNRVDFHRLCPASMLLQRAVMVSMGEAAVPCLSPLDALQLAVFHYYGHRPADRKHLWLYDVALLWPLAASQPRAVLGRHLLPAMTGLLDAMRQELEQVFSDPVFPAIHTADNGGAVTFVPYAEARVSKWVDFRHRWRQLGSWRARLGLVAEYLFQSRDYVARRFGVSSGWRLWLCYPRMWVQDLRRLFSKNNP